MLNASESEVTMVSRFRPQSSALSPDSEVRARSAEADRSLSTARPPTRETGWEREASLRCSVLLFPTVPRNSLFIGHMTGDPIS